MTTNYEPDLQAARYGMFVGMHLQELLSYSKSFTVFGLPDTGFVPQVFLSDEDNDLLFQLLAPLVRNAVVIAEVGERWWISGIPKSDPDTVLKGRGSNPLYAIVDLIGCVNRHEPVAARLEREASDAALDKAMDEGFSVYDFVSFLADQHVTMINSDGQTTGSGTPESWLRCYEKARDLPVSEEAA